MPSVPPKRMLAMASPLARLPRMSRGSRVRTTTSSVQLAKGAGSSAHYASEKLVGTAVSRLLLSGETRAVIDVTGLGFDADAAARVGLAAALRAWRHDRYRTTLKDKQKPSLQEVIVVGGGEGAAELYANRWAPVYEGVSLARELVTEPANIIYPETFVERVRASVNGSGLEVEVLDRAAMEKLGMGALLGVAQPFPPCSGPSCVKAGC